MTGRDGRIDLMHDLTRLYEREDMLAFFDFALRRPGQAPLAGLCRVAQPREGAARLAYLSLTFVVDTPDAAARQDAVDAIGRITPAALRSALPEVREVLPVPVLGISAGTDENLVTQLDLLLQGEPPRAFIPGQLVPAVGRLAGFQVTDFVWWQSSRPPSSADAGSPRPAEAGEGLVARLRRFLRGQIGRS